MGVGVFSGKFLGGFLDLICEDVAFEVGCWLAVGRLILIDMASFFATVEGRFCFCGKDLSAL